MLHYNRPVKKSVSCKKAARLLKLSESEFNELAILLNIRPQEFKNRHKDDFEHKLHYSIVDVQKMIDSDAYMTIHKRNKIKKTRKEYIKYGRVERLERMKDVEFEYMKIIKQRYPLFKDAVIDIGQSLTLLFFAVKLSDADRNSTTNEFIYKNNTKQNVDNEVKDNANTKYGQITNIQYNFEVKDNVNTNHEQLNNIHCNFEVQDSIHDEVKNNIHDETKNNIHYNAEVKDNYKTRHENDKKIIKKFVDLLNESEVSKLKKEMRIYNAKDLLIEFKNLLENNGFVKKCFLMNNGCHYLASLDDIEICWTEPYKSNKNIDYDDLDISEIKYLFKFSYYHTKTVLHKLSKIYNKEENDKKTLKIFDNITFYIENANEHIEYIIKCGKGSIKTDYKNVDYYITENNIKDFDVNKKYVYPQFVIDSYNSCQVLDYTKYITGKEIPEHVYPFTKNEKLQINQNNLVLLSKTKRRKIDEILKEAEDKKY